MEFKRLKFVGTQRHTRSFCSGRAYEGQLSYLTCFSREITAAGRRGRVDAIIQSTDKNFMVPVGGSIIAAMKSNPSLVLDVNKSYPGRAAVSAHFDILATLLHWGRTGWMKVIIFNYLFHPFFIPVWWSFLFLQAMAGVAHSQWFLGKT